MRDIVFQAEEVAQAQGALRRRCSQDARLTGETMPARLRAHPRITGESRTCRSRPLAAGSLCGAAAPREVVIGGELRTPFSLSPQPIPTEGNVESTENPFGKSLGDRRHAPQRNMNKAYDQYVRMGGGGLRNG